LIMAAEPKPDGFEQAQSMEELGRKLLREVGLENEEAMTQDMVQRAIDAQDDFVAKLSEIAAGH
jgi:hypothetical protein